MASSKTFTIFTKFAVKNGFSGPVLKMAKGADLLAARTDKTMKTLGKIGGAAVGIGKSLASWGAIGAAGAILVGKQFSDAGAQVEKYKATLKVMLGSQEAANARFEEMSKFATSTPFELPQVVELGNQLQALGKYSLENMTILGDLAAASGKPIDQVSRAFAKLASGQKGVAVDMFRDLLITTEDWSKATGKGITKNGELMATTAELMAALPKIMESKKFSGMMAEQAKTFEGMASNLSDSVTRFKQNIGMSMNESLKKFMPKIQAQIEKMSAWAAKNADKIISIFDGVFGFIDRLATTFGPLLGDLFNALQPVLKPLLGILEPIFKIFENLMPLITGLVNVVSSILAPILETIKFILNGVASLTTSNVNTHEQRVNAQGSTVSKPGSGAARFPVSPNAGVISSSTTTTNRSTVDVNVNGLPTGSSVKQTGAAPGVTLNTGKTVQWRHGPAGKMVQVNP